MRTRVILGLVVGVALAVALFRVFGTQGIGHAFDNLGWRGFVAVVGYHAALTVVLALPWSQLLRGSAKIHPASFVWARFIRDSASQALPLSPVGGMVLGARALTASGVPGALATASLIVDIGIEMGGLVCYALIGLGLLCVLKPHSELIAPFAAALGLMAIAALGFILVQNRGSGAVGRWIGRITARFTRAQGSYVFALPQALEQIHARSANLLIAWLFHTTCWLLTAVEMWVTLRLMGISIHFGGAVVMDSLAFIMRSIVFMVPSGIGVQEGAFVLLGALFGVGAQSALAVSLVRRARDIAIAVPPLVVWQLHEGGKFWHLRAAPADPRTTAPAAAEKDA
jgi:putative membrane protein